MKNKINKTISRILSPAFFIAVIALMLLGCEKEEIKLTGELELATPELTVNATEGTVQVEVNSNMKWKIGDLEDDWYSLSAHEGDANEGFEIIYNENSDIDMRSGEFIVVTVDGKGFQTLSFHQLGADPVFDLEVETFEADPRGRRHSINVSTNVPESSIDFQVDYDVVPEEDWILGIEVEQGVLSFSTALNANDIERVGHIVLSYNGAVDGEAELAVLKVIQAKAGDLSNAEERDFVYVKQLQEGMIDEFIYIKGNVVYGGDSENYLPGRYIIQNDQGQALVFNPSEEISFEKFDAVEILVDGLEVESVTEDGYTFKMISGLTSANLMKREANNGFAVPEFFIGDLTDDQLFAVVTLRDVEFSIPFGGYTNMNEYWVGQGIAPTQYYPNSLRDINGDDLYILTNREVSYRKKSVPQGSGKITGLIVRDLDSYYGDLGPFSVRVLEESDIDMNNERDNGFSEVLVEWDCAKPANFTEGMKHIPPRIGDPDAVLSKSNSTGFYSGYNATSRIYFLTEYRGDAPSNGNVSVGGYNSTDWFEGEHWIFENIATTGITSQLSLQVEVNSSTNDGARDFVVEYSTDGGNSWSLVEEYTSIPYLNSGKVTGIAGFKMFNFNLPADASGQSELKVRLKCASQYRVDGTIAEKLGTGRIVHASIKYNK